MNMSVVSRSLLLGVSLAALACTTAESDEGAFTFTTDAEAEESGDEIGETESSSSGTDDSSLTDGNTGPGFCGDGTVQDDAGEECDLGSDNGSAAACTPECKLAACGDGYVYEGFEECDDGNQANGDACVMGCKLASCGDGFVQEGVEECDDGNDVPDDTCTNECIALCGDDCWSEFGCFTPAGRCVKFSCRAGNAGPNFCDSCMGWQEITYDQWMNQGYCGDIIQTYRTHYGTQTRCGQAASCCADEASCGGGDNAWHFHDGVQNHYVGPCLGCANDVNCSYWNGTDSSTYTRITACERG